MPPWKHYPMGKKVLIADTFHTAVPVCPQNDKAVDESEESLTLNFIPNQFSVCNPLLLACVLTAVRLP